MSRQRRRIGAAGGRRQGAGFRCQGLDGADKGEQHQENEDQAVTQYAAEKAAVELVHIVPESAVVGIASIVLSLGEFRNVAGENDQSFKE